MIWGFPSDLWEEQTIFAELLDENLNGLLKDNEDKNFCLVNLRDLQNAVGVVPKVVVFFEAAPYFVSLGCLHQQLNTSGDPLLIAMVRSSSILTLSS